MYFHTLLGSESLFANVAYKRFFSSVGPAMNFQRSFLRKCRWADITCKRRGMGSFVNRQAWLVDKHRWTFIAFKCLLTLVSFYLVHHQVRFLHKDRRTCIAFEGVFTCVCSYVFYPSIFRPEGIEAHVTLERLFSGVDHFVCLQNCFGSKCILADVTYKWFGICVNLFMFV